MIKQVGHIIYYAKKWYNKCKPYSIHNNKWIPNERIGCAIDINLKTISYYSNGKSLGSAFIDIDIIDGISPAITMKKGNKCLFLNIDKISNSFINHKQITFNGVTDMNNKNVSVIDDNKNDDNENITDLNDNLLIDIYNVHRCLFL